MCIRDSTTSGWANASPSVTLPDTWRDGATAVHLSQLGRYARTTAKVASSMSSAERPRGAWGAPRGTVLAVTLSLIHI